MNEFAIETDGLTKFYGSRRGVEDVSIRVPTGCIYGFLGPNGAGKTTTIRALMGFLRVSHGTGRVAGFDIRSQSLYVRQNVGHLPGDVRFYNHLTGAEMLGYLAALRRRPCMDQAQHLAKVLDLDLDVRIRYFSRGMRQKLGIIQAMMHRPAVLILDEPTNSLDPLVQQTVYELLSEYAAAGGTVFFSSHIISEVERICERVAIVRCGRLVADDAICDLRHKSSQNVHLVLKAGSSLPAVLPTGMRLARHEGNQYHLVWQGPTELLQLFLSTMTLDYLVIEPPSLEEVFMKFYREDDHELA